MVGNGPLDGVRARSRPGDGVGLGVEQLEAYSRRQRRPDLRSVGGLDPPGRLPTDDESQRAGRELEHNPEERRRKRETVKKQRWRRKKRTSPHTREREGPPSELGNATVQVLTPPVK